MPGSVGGAVRMNAGGHGSDLASCLVDVDVVDLRRRDPARRLAGRRLGLRFRGSDLPTTHVVVAGGCGRAR